jgi:trimeric autotransporter adhesin
MKRKILFLLYFACSLVLYAQEKLYIHRSDKMTLGAFVSQTDSIYFSADQSTTFFRIGDTLAYYPVSSIDSINFGPNTDTVFINHNGSDVTVFNPLAFEGVNVIVSGSDVTVHSSTEQQDVYYCLSGATTDGMFKIYSAKKYNLLLNGVSITNPDGPAINIQSRKNTTVMLADGTTNTLTDGATYADPPAGEDQDGTFFSEARLLFSGSGTLVINGHGSAQHGLCCDDRIKIEDGVIRVNSAVRDGVHAKKGLSISGGIINVTSSEDGIDGDSGILEISGGDITTANASDDVSGLTGDSVLLVSGGNISITVSGDQSRGISSSFPVTLSGGTISIYNSGSAALIPSGSGYDPSYCTAIRSIQDVTIAGASITIVASGEASRGITSDADIVMTSGSVQVTSSGNGATYQNSTGAIDAYFASCFNTTGDLRIKGGSVTTYSSGSAGKGICTASDLVIGDAENSPAIQITTTGNKILISGQGQNANYAEAKAVKTDNAVTVNNGSITIASSDDGIKAAGSITINNGTVTISNSVEGMETPYIIINDGNVHIKASDDAINTTFGNGGEDDDNSLLTINGGWVVANAEGGDGLDCNGDLEINGGTVIVHGPQSAPEVGMDYNGTCNMNGGLLVISGTDSDMTQAPSNSSDQKCVRIMANQGMSGSTLFHIQDASGNDLLTFQPARSYYSIVFSSADLQSGITYSIYTGGTSTGTSTDGLYSGGTYSGGTFKKSFTINNTITNVNF